MQTTSLAGRTVLIAEDEPIVALDVSHEFEGAGARVLLAHTVKQALGFADENELSAAVLDHVLVDGNSAELCNRLDQRHIPYLSYTGWERIDGACANGEHVSKPTNPAVLVSKVAALILKKQYP